MRFDDVSPDRELSQALRRFDRAPSASAWELGVLARRIVANAGPLLDRRRLRAVSWWEYAAVWARTLIPLGITTTLVAVACILWTSLTPLPVPVTRLASHDASFSIAGDPISDGLLDMLVEPVERAATPMREPR